MSSAKKVSEANRQNYVELGLKIAYYRKLMGLTQEQLAERVGISRSHLSAIEAPNIIRPFSLELLFDVAKALKIKPSCLMEFQE